jgi:3-oxoadipate enol-lactonase
LSIYAEELSIEQKKRYTSRYSICRGYRAFLLFGGGAFESIKKDGVDKFADESIQNLFAPESFTTKKEEIAAVRDMIVNTTKESLNKTLRAFYERKETCSKLSEIKVPVLLMVGKEDKITLAAAAQMMHEKI